MEITQDTPVMPVVFTSQDTNAVAKSCLLLLRTELPSTEIAVCALTSALTEWTRSTQAGIALATECQFDITIADLAGTSVFSNSDLLRIMLEHGLEFVACHGIYCEPNIPIDRLLVDVAQCEDKPTQIESFDQDPALAAL